MKLNLESNELMAVTFGRLAEIPFTKNPILL
jgi:hypothetical protein